MTFPFITQIDTCHNSHYSTAWRKDDPQMLVFCITLYSIFLVTGICIQFTLAIIDRSIFKNVFYF